MTQLPADPREHNNVVTMILFIVVRLENFWLYQQFIEYWITPLMVKKSFIGVMLLHIEEYPNVNPTTSVWSDKELSLTEIEFVHTLLLIV